MTNNQPLTIYKIADRIAIHIGLYIAISLLVSIILIIIDSIFFIFLPFITGIVALIFVIKMIAGAVKWNKEKNYPFRNAYIVGAVIIIVIETIAVSWMVYVISGIRWM